MIKNLSIEIKKNFYNVKTLIGSGDLLSDPHYIKRLLPYLHASTFDVYFEHSDFISQENLRAKFVTISKEIQALVKRAWDLDVYITTSTAFPELNFYSMDYSSRVVFEVRFLLNIAQRGLRRKLGTIEQALLNFIVKRIVQTFGHSKT